MAKTLDYNFAVDKSLVADTGPTLTCTRSGDATYFDASGVMQTAGTNTARFDHDPSDSNASLGLLVEEARTNVCTYSEDMSNWSSTGATIDTDAATSPDGITTADRLNISATTDLHHTFESTGTTTTNTDHAISVFLKDDGVQYAVVNWGDATGNDHISACYDLVGQTVTDTDVGSTSGTIAATGIEDVGNGWLRCWIAGKVTPTATFLLVSGSDSATPAWNAYGSVTAWLGVEGEDLLIWGAQCEAGAFPTSYIPTTTASVTRAKDNINKSGMTGVFSDTDSTLYVKWSRERAMAAAAPTLSLIYITDGGAATESIATYYTSSINQSTITTSAGGNNGNITSPSWGSGNEFAVGITADDMELYIEGSRIGTGDQTVFHPTGLDEIDVGQNYAAGGQINGHIQRIVYYNERLADSVLEDLSNGTFPTFGDPRHVFGITQSVTRNITRNITDSWSNG